MTLGKGLARSAFGAAIGAAVWFAGIRLSGWNLWVLAPVIGGAAGFGMMRGTQMKGGWRAGALAGVLTLAAIFAARWAAVSQRMHDEAKVTEADAVAELEDEAAAELQGRGAQVYEADGGYSYRVRSRARRVWDGMSEYERMVYMKAREQENEAAAGALTPLRLVLDFGVFGTICAALAAGTAFKTGSATLEGALSGRGLSDEEVAAEATRMRTEDAGSSQGRWALPVRTEERTAPKSGEETKRTAA